jgi:hypothetical protein
VGIGISERMLAQRASSQVILTNKKILSPHLFRAALLSSVRIQSNRIMRRQSNRAVASSPTRIGQPSLPTGSARKGHMNRPSDVDRRLAFTDEQRKAANDMVCRMAERPSTPSTDAEILRLIAHSATKRSASDDAPAPASAPAPKRPRLRLVECA